MLVDGRDVMPDVRAALHHIRSFSEAVRSGRWVGYSGLRITDIVNTDFCAAVIRSMLAAHARPRPRMRWRVADITRLDPAAFPDAAYDLAKIGPLLEHHPIFPEIFLLIV